MNGVRDTLPGKDTLRALKRSRYDPFSLSGRIYE